MLQSCLTSQEGRPEVGWGEGRALGAPLILLPSGGREGPKGTLGPGHFSAELGPLRGCCGCGPPDRQVRRHLSGRY